MSLINGEALVRAAEVKGKRRQHTMCYFVRFLYINLLLFYFIKCQQGHIINHNEKELRHPNVSDVKTVGGTSHANVPPGKIEVTSASYTELRNHTGKENSTQEYKITDEMVEANFSLVALKVNQSEGQQPHYKPHLDEGYSLVVKTIIPQLRRKGALKWGLACFIKDGQADWTSEGCNVSHNGDSYICECTQKEKSTSDDVKMIQMKMCFWMTMYNKLPAIVITLCKSFDSVSVATLFVACVLLAAMRRTINEQNRRFGNGNSNFTTLRHFCLCFSLLIVHLLIVLGQYMMATEQTCVLRGLLSNYFVLSSGCWMLLEGIAIYRKTLSSSSLSIPFVKLSKRVKMLLYFTLPWLFPVVYVAIVSSIALSSNSYLVSSDWNKIETDLWSHIGSGDDREVERRPFMKYGGCWLDRVTSLYAVGVPMVMMILPNLVIAILVTRKVWKIKNEDKNTREMLKSSNQVGSVARGTEKTFVSFTPDTALQSMQFSDGVYNRTSVDLGSINKRISINVNTTESPLKTSVRSFLILFVVLGVPWIALLLGSIAQVRMFITGLHLVTSSLQGLITALIFCFVNRSVRNALVYNYQSIKKKCFKK